MRMKTYQADSMQEALLQVKNEMGPESVILKSTKKVKNILGKKKAYFEVTAALDPELFAKPEDNSSDTKNLKTYGRDKKVDAPKEEETADNFESSRKITPESPVQNQAITLAEMKTIREEIREMMHSVGDIKTSLRHMDLDSVPSEFVECFEGLLELDVDPDLARELVRKLGQIISGTKRRDTAYVQKILKKVVANRIPSSDTLQKKPGRPKVVMLVGPTGVGKTTTIAKISGIYKYEKKWDVAIISADAKRMGATEQMKAFCRASQIPMDTAFSSEDAMEALKGFSQKDLVLIDTAGASKNDPESWRELQNLIGSVSPDEIHLVMSATTKSKDNRRLLEHYKQLGASQLIFTKLDESFTLGTIYNICCENFYPLSYVCNGQNIPDNILEAESSEISAMILEELFQPG